MFDTQYRLTDQTTGSIQDLTFTLDDAGNIEGIDDAVNGSLHQTFAYDELNRLDSDSGAYGSKSYVFAWESTLRFDRTGAPHFNKTTGKDVPTPHVHDPRVPGGVRPAAPGEIPR